MSAPQDIRGKIKALLSKNTAAGCSEGEAMLAAQKAAELMAKYQIDARSIHIETERVDTSTMGSVALQKITGVICFCTNCEAIYIQGNATRVEFFGHAPGPQIAAYLRDICMRAMRSELAKFKKTKLYISKRIAKTRRIATQAFLSGISSRIAARLRSLFAPSISKEQRELASIALDTAYPQSTDHKIRAANLSNLKAQMAGWNAGADVALSHGVSGTQAPLQIGGA